MQFITFEFFQNASASTAAGGMSGVSSSVNLSKMDGAASDIDGGTDGEGGVFTRIPSGMTRQVGGVWWLRLARDFRP